MVAVERIDSLILPLHSQNQIIYGEKFITAVPVCHAFCINY